MSPARPERQRATRPETASGGLLERVAAALLTAVIACRQLTPTDGAATGETIWIAQFALLVVAVWVFAMYRAGVLRLEFDWIDGAVLLLCLGHVGGALVVTVTSGDKRGALNLLWEWCGVLATFFLLRRIVTTSGLRRNLLLVVAATAVSLSGLGVWQHYGGYAETRREYEKIRLELQSLEREGEPSDPRAAAEWQRALQRVRANLMSMNVPLDDSARVLWEQRLNSSEPIGMFALANTLAGVLACTAVVWLGLLVAAGGRGAWWQRAVAWALGILLLYCLLLTKSRTAFVGLTAGMVVWTARTGLWRSAERRRWRWLLAGGILAAAGLIVVAATSGGIDHYVLSESAKSLRYRFEYWQATWHMLIDSPRNWLLGVGPGNFRQNYLPFKLPQSSEEIADPHNALLDVWANGGIVALAGLAGLCAAGLRPLWRRRTDPADEGDAPSWRDGILAGGALGYLAVFIAGGASDERIILLLLGWMCIVAMYAALIRFEAFSVVCAAAFTALAVHLLGAGGIGMPGIVQLLLLLAVFGASVDRPAAWHWATNSRPAIAAVGLTGLGLYFGCWFTGLIPVISAREKLSLGEYELMDERRPARAEREFLLAAQADPWSAEPYRQLSQLTFQIWLGSDTKSQEAFDRSIAWQKKAIDRDPRLYAGHRYLGEMYLAKFARTADRPDAESAVAAFEQAAALYPNQAQVQSGLAESLWNAGSQEPAQQAARRALALDAINEQAGHIDKLLPADRREMMNRIVEKAN
jgi:tetratricopeptide (TPR) repeat protein